jgi:actin-related protein
MSEINASELRSNERNLEVLNKWREKVKSATDSRLKEIVGHEGTREELENQAVESFAFEEQFFLDELKKPDVDATTIQAVRMGIEMLQESLTRQSKEEIQEELKQEYEEDQKLGWTQSDYRKMRLTGCPKKCKCPQCGDMFFTVTFKQVFCSRRCRIAFNIRMRKVRREEGRTRSASSAINRLLQSALMPSFVVIHIELGLV